MIAASGSDEHPILIATDEPSARVAGTVFALSEAELAAADRYEVDAYTRTEVPLEGGGTAWVYAFDPKPVDLLMHDVRRAGGGVVDPWEERA